MKSLMSSLWRDYYCELKKLTFILYLVQCALGASLCYALYLFFPEHEFSWAIISVLLVLAPETKDSLKLSLDRIKANITGAGVGLVYFTLVPSGGLISLVAAVITTILICTFLKLGNATRTALAALVIVLIQNNRNFQWNIAFERMVSVVLGCLVAMLITAAFSRLTKRSMKYSAERRVEDGE